MHAGTEDRADQEGEDPASSMFETAFVECLPEYLTETESTRAALFEKFVEEVGRTPDCSASLELHLILAYPIGHLHG